MFRSEGFYFVRIIYIVGITKKHVEYVDYVDKRD